LIQHSGTPSTAAVCLQLPLSTRPIPAPYPVDTASSASCPRTGSCYAACVGVIIILLVAGALLLFLETVLPGLIAGIVGLGCLVAGVTMAYTEFGASTGNIVLVGVLVGLIAGFFLYVRYFPESRIANALTAKGTSGELHVEQPGLLNATGLAYSNLRPSGTAMIEGKRVDVVTEGALIPKGAPIKVVAIEGLRVVVRAIPSEEMSEPKPAAKQN